MKDVRLYGIVLLLIGAAIGFALGWIFGRRNLLWQLAAALVPAEPAPQPGLGAENIAERKRRIEDIEKTWPLPAIKKRALESALEEWVPGDDQIRINDRPKWEVQVYNKEPIGGFEPHTICRVELGDLVTVIGASKERPLALALLLDHGKAERDNLSAPVGLVFPVQIGYRQPTGE